MKRKLKQPSLLHSITVTIWAPRLSKDIISSYFLKKHAQQLCYSEFKRNKRNGSVKSDLRGDYGISHFLDTDGIYIYIYPKKQHIYCNSVCNEEFNFK